MNVLKVMLFVFFALNFIGCDGFSSLTKEQNANRLIVEMDKMLPELNLMAQSDLAQLNADDREYMRKFVSKYIQMADYVIEVNADEDKISPSSLDNINLNRQTAVELMQKLDKFS